MPPLSSPSSISSSPNLKRKQQSISSFFTKKVPVTEKGPSKSSSEDRSSQPEKKVSTGKENNKDEAGSHEQDEDDEDIVLPAPKKTRVIDSSKEPVEEPDQTGQSYPSSGAGRTERFRFESSQVSENGFDGHADQDSRGNEKARREKDKLHQKFVKRLGGADCLIGIGRPTAAEEEAASTEALGEGDEDEEPAPPPTKGKAGAKKGGSKLTPMEKQIIEIKRKHMDTILVVEVGYKFRFFGEDARVAAKELSIVCIPGKMRFDERM
jgi:DNA mismatch repair protein MSH3